MRVMTHTILCGAQPLSNLTLLLHYYYISSVLNNLEMSLQTFQKKIRNLIPTIMEYIEFSKNILK